jgi:hypothetical protein
MTHRKGFGRKLTSHNRDTISEFTWSNWEKRHRACMVHCYEYNLLLYNVSRQHQAEQRQHKVPGLCFPWATNSTYKCYSECQASRGWVITKHHRAESQKKLYLFTWYSHKAERGMRSPRSRHLSPKIDTMLPHWTFWCHSDHSETYFPSLQKKKVGIRDEVACSVGKFSSQIWNQLAYFHEISYIRYNMSIIHTSYNQ